MSNQYLKLRRSSIPGKIPSTSSIDFGELALNTVDGKVYMKITSSLGQSVIAVNPSEITGSFYGTASFALNSDYSLRPVSYRGTTLYSTIPLTQNVSPSYSIFLGEQAGQNTTSSVVYAVYLGYNAGYSSTNATSSVFIGLSPGYQSDNAHDSIFIGTSAGSRANYASSSVFLGKLAGYQAASASYSILLGYNVGRNTAINTGIGNNNIIIGNNITLEDNRKDSINIGSIIFATGSTFTTGLYPYSGSSVDGKVGINVVKPQYTLDVSGSGNFTGPVYANITGSLFGTGSWSNNSISSSVALSSSYALTSSYSNIATSSSYSATSSLSISSISSSYATTSSWAYNVVSASNSQTASLALTASYAPNYLPLVGGTITGNLIVQGTASIAYLNTVYESASVIYSSGSNQFGDASNDTQTLYGTVNLPTGSLNVLAGSVNAQVFSGSGQYLYNIPASAISGSISGSGGGGGGTISGSGVSGQVTYWNGTSAVSGDNNLIWNSASIRLGIGRTPAARRLELQVANGSIAAAIGIYDGGGSLNTIFGIDTASTTDFQIASIQSIRFYAGSTLGNIVTNPTNERMRLFGSTGNLVLQNGGTFTDSGYRLDVNGTGAASGSLRVSGSSLFDINSGSFSIASGSNTFVFVSSSGNVGIGTSSPSDFLNVKGSTTYSGITLETTGQLTKSYIGNYQGSTFQLGSNRRIDGVISNASAAVAYINCYVTNNLSHITLVATNTNGVDGKDILRAWGSGNVTIQNGGTFTDDGQRLQVIGSAKITSGLTVSGSGGSAYALTTTNGWVQFGSTTGFTWDNTNNALLLGTNTYSTGKYIDLVFNATFGGKGMRIRNTNTLGYSELIFDNDTTPDANGAFVFGYGGTATTNPNEAYFWNRRNAALLYGTNNTERMRIQGNGDVLIGSVSGSGYRLEVNGSGSASGSLRVVSGSTLLVGAGSTSATNALVVQNSSATSLFSVRNDAVYTFGEVGTTVTVNMGSDGFSSIRRSTSGTNGMVVYGPYNSDHTLTVSSYNSNNYNNGAQSTLRLLGNFVDSTGTTAFSYLNIGGTVNQTGTSTSQIYGVFINPTLTSAPNYRAIQWNNNTTWGIYGSGSASNYLAGRLSIGTTVTGSALTVYKSGSTVVDVQGSTGQLFSVVDSMTGSLMSVNDISGIPLLSVNSNGAMYMNSALQNSITSSYVVYSIDSNSGNAAYFDYRVFSPITSGSRAGTLMAVWFGSSVEYTDTSTNDLIADTSGISLSADITGSLLRVNATVTTGSWNVKIGARVI